jgi:integrase/lambda repressor-like predicted transcriptional regulator
MPTIADHIRAHLDATGKSMRALSLEAGFSEGWAKDVLRGASKRPGAEALARVSAIIGVDLCAIPNERVVSAADALRLLAGEPPAGWSPSQVKGAKTAIRFYVEQSGAGGPDTTLLEPQRVRAFLKRTTAATHGLAESTYGAYATHLKNVLDLVRAIQRPRQIRDVLGPWRDLYDEIKGADLPDYIALSFGPFCAWCHFSGLAIGDVCPETFADYLSHKLAHGRLKTGEAQHRDTVREVHGVGQRLSAMPAFAAMGVRSVASPFPDGRDKYQMPADLLAPLLAEFDKHILPWARGEVTPDGRCVDAVLDQLEPVEVPEADQRKAAMQKFLGRQSRVRREAREDRLREAGVLIGNSRWGSKTQANARAAVASLAKALWSKTDVVIESIEDLTDPVFLEAAGTALDEANDEEGVGSSYVESVLKKCKKLARGFIQRSNEDIASIEKLIQDFTPDFAGIAPRNRTKLQQLTPERTTAFLRMSKDIIAEVNAELARRRGAAIRSGRAAETADLLDAELAGLLEIALAHDIMLARAPRPGNLLAIYLEQHLRRRADGGITIEIPKHLVKTRVNLSIPLGLQQSHFLDAYVAHVRPMVMSDRNRANTRLFPSRHADEGHYTLLTKRLIDEVHRRIGIRIHPHLYRHIAGWIWLREDPNALPAVQKLLGHKRLETTMTFYAELDETLALQEWSEILEEKNKDGEPAPAPGVRHRGRRGSGWREAA